MRTGLLICDHINPQYKEKFGDYPDMFKALFPEFEWRLYDVCNGEFPKNVNECDVYFTTGSRHSVYEDINWILRLKGFLRVLYKEQKHYVGMCFGHQMLCEALGGKVTKSERGWCVGVHSFEMKEKADWMTPYQENINLLMMCQDQISVLPQEAKVLASNDMCPAGMIQVRDRMLGIQAHLEFPKAYDEALMKARIERMGTDVVVKGIESLALPVSMETVRSWIFEFLGYEVEVV